MAWVGKEQRPMKGPWIVLPSFRGKELVAVKYLHLKRRDGKKLTLVEPNCEPCLFGWQAIPENARTVALCEGEIDAVTLWQYGFPALPCPSAAARGETAVDRDGVSQPRPVRGDLPLP